MINISDWYWSVAGSTTQVWSSARCEYVAISDTSYLAWLQINRKSTPILNAAELYDVLMKQWAPAIQSAGIEITSTATPALNGTYAIDTDSTANLSALSTGIAAGKPLPGGGTTFMYLDAARAPHAFGAADFLNFAAAVESYLYNFQMQLLSLLNGVGGAAMPSSALTIA